MHGLCRLVLACLFCLVAVPASAQVLTFSTAFDGELDADGEQGMRDALQQGLSDDGRAEVLDEATTAEALGGSADCAEPTCAAAAGDRVSAQVAVHASVYAEAEIYDFVVTIYDANDGTVLAEQVGDCTFCPIAEAIESFRFTGEAALNSISPLPAASLDAPEEPSAPAVAIRSGELQFNVSAVPADAEIRVNGQVVGTGRARLNVGPQELVITLLADGYETLEETVEVSPSMEGPIYMRAHLSPVVTVVEVPTGRAPRASGTDVNPGFDRRSVGGVLIGTGTVALAGGIVMLAIDGNSTCSEGPLTSCPTVVETTAGGIALTAVGALVAGTGTGLVLSTMQFGGGDEGDQARAGTLRLAPTFGGAMLSLDASF